MSSFKQHHRPSSPDTAPGQSLVEFVLVLPIFLAILLGGVSMGVGMYQAHMASDAVRTPILHKMEMSGMTGAINSEVLLDYMNNGRRNNVDEVRILNGDPYTSLIVGTKRHEPLFPLVPGFQITSSQSINRNLLQEASAGSAPVRPYGTAWMPTGTPVKPPWK